jgi:flagellar FliJ protein
MKKFKFRYEQLLNIRIKKVDDLKNTMGQLNFKLNSLEEEKEAKLSAQSSFFSAINDLLSKGCSSQELIMVNSQKSFYKETIKVIDNQIREVKLEIIQVRDQLNEALKEQKIMEKLKEKEYERYLEAIEVTEAKVTEEIVNYINYKGREE